MEPDMWNLVTRIIAVVTMGTLVGQVLGKIANLATPIFFQVAAKVIEASSLFSSLMVTSLILSTAIEKPRVPDGQSTAFIDTVGTLSGALGVYLGVFACTTVAIGLITLMFHTAHIENHDLLVGACVTAGALSVLIVGTLAGGIVASVVTIVTAGNIPWNHALNLVMPLAIALMGAMIATALLCQPKLRSALATRWRQMIADLKRMPFAAAAPDQRRGRLAHFNNQPACESASALPPHRDGDTLKSE